MIRYIILFISFYQYQYLCFLVLYIMHFKTSVKLYCYWRMCLNILYFLFFPPDGFQWSYMPVQKKKQLRQLIF